MKHFLAEYKSAMHFSAASKFQTTSWSLVLASVQNPLVDSEAAGVYASGRLLFLRKGTLFVQEFDPVKLTLSGSPAPLVFLTPGTRHAMDWSRDGRYLLFQTYENYLPHLWVLRVDGMQEIQILPDNLELRWPQFSPDVKWIAFQSVATGRNEVHIYGPFAPPSMGKISKALSINGGAWVRWSGDGKELFYAALDGTLMSIPLEFDADGKDFKAGTPVALFKAPMAGPTTTASRSNTWFRRMVGFWLSLRPPLNHRSR
jgi:hypothetical protein